MFKKSMVWIVLLALTCALTGVGWAQDGLVGAWSFDEGSGEVAGDGSGGL